MGQSILSDMPWGGTVRGKGVQSGSELTIEWRGGWMETSPRRGWESENGAAACAGRDRVLHQTTHRTVPRQSTNQSTAHIKAPRASRTVGVLGDLEAEEEDDDGEDVGHVPRQPKDVHRHGCGLWLWLLLVD